MKKVFLIFGVVFMFIAFYTVNADATNVEISEGTNNIVDAKAWMSRCPNGCQWDTQVDCGDRGARSCTTGNGCGNCGNQ